MAGIADLELTGDPDMDRMILAARDAQGVSRDVGQSGLSMDQYQQAVSNLAAYRNLPENVAYRNTVRPELGMLAGGLLSLAVPGVASGIVGTLFPGAAATSAGAAAALGGAGGGLGTLGTTALTAGVGGALGAGLAEATGRDPLTGALGGMLGGGLGAGAQGATALSSLSAAGPSVIEQVFSDENYREGGVIPEQPYDTRTPPVTPTNQEGGGGGAVGGGGGAAGGAAGGATPTPDGEVQGGVSDAPGGVQDVSGGGLEATTGVDAIVANQILEAILAETDANVRGGLISDWENYTGETFDDTLLPDYQEQQPVEPVGYVWSPDGWQPVFDIPATGGVIFEPGASVPDYTPDDQQDEVADIIDAAGAFENVLDSTVDSDTTTTVEPVDTTTVEPVDTTTVEPTDGTDGGGDGGGNGGGNGGGDGSDDGTDTGGGEGTGTGEGEGGGEGTGSGEGKGGDGGGIGLGAGLMAAAAGAAFEPQWRELFKYTTLTPYQKKALAPYVDYIAQARGMTGRGMLS